MNIQLIYWDYEDKGTLIFSCYVNSFPPYQIGQYLYLSLNDSKEAPDYYTIKEINFHITEKKDPGFNRLYVTHRMDISLINGIN